jgi:RNase P subunit RPR2
MATIASPPYSTMCTQCGAVLIFPEPEWSENVEGQKTIYIWHCLVCGNEFETKDEAAQEQPSDAELVQEFFPSLLVG